MADTERSLLKPRSSTRRFVQRSRFATLLKALLWRSRNCTEVRPRRESSMREKPLLGQLTDTRRSQAGGEATLSDVLSQNTWRRASCMGKETAVNLLLGQGTHVEVGDVRAGRLMSGAVKRRQRMEVKRIVV